MNRTHKTAVFGLLKYIDVFCKSAGVSNFLEQNKSLLDSVFELDINTLEEYKSYIDTAHNHLLNKKDLNICYLSSIFEEIGNKEKKHNFYYPMKALSLNKECIFPSNKGGNLKQDLSSLYENFYKDFLKIKDFKLLKALNFLYYLTQKYFWCVGIDEDLSVSLFDHMRISQLSVVL